MKPKKLNEVKKQMNDLLHKVVYGEDIMNPSIAFTYTRTNTLCGTIYRMFINDKDPELKDYLYMHECGHILFAHTRGMDLRNDRFLHSKIQAAFSKIAKMFNNYTKDLELFKNSLFNIVMDFEVNSRLFSEDEWNFMNERVSLLTKCPGSKGMWPQDYDLPPGLTWNEYLNLILMDPKKFMETFREMIAQKILQKKAGDKGSFTQEEYEKYVEEMRGKKFNEDEMKELASVAQDHSESTFDVPNGLMKGKSKTSNKPCFIDFVKYENYSDLLKKIIKELRFRIQRPDKRDPLYNSNRKKFNTNIIIPKDVKKDFISTSKRLYLLIDVSGSVDASMVHNFISTFRTIKDNFRKVQIITWNTNLVAEWNINEPIQNYYGGGTNIASGINYIRTNYNPKQNDVLFVISDFQDDLPDWNNELKAMSCRKYAIDWSATKGAYNPGFKTIFSRS